MKRLLLFLLFLSPIFSEAQTSVYHPFPDSNAVWCSFYGQGCGACTTDCHNCYEEYSTFYLNGIDTINNTIYNRLYWFTKTYYFICDNHTLCDYNSKMTTLHIRQDALLKKVWIYDTLSHSDHTFYDFNLQVGDTLNTSKVYWGWGLLVVTSIDSILIGTDYRKRINYYNDCGSVFETDTSMVEGIGALQGLLYSPNCPDRVAILAHFSENSQNLYDYTAWGYDSCYDFPTFIKQSVTPNAFSISPNPAHDKLNVECASTPLSMTNAELKIYNVTGREVFATTLNTKHETLNLSLSPALYFVRVSDGEKQAVQKLIIE